MVFILKRDSFLVPMAWQVMMGNGRVLKCFTCFFSIKGRDTKCIGLPSLPYDYLYFLNRYMSQHDVQHMLDNILLVQ